MKSLQVKTALAALAIAALTSTFVGCGKKDEPQTPTTEDAKKAGDSVADAVGKTAEAVKTEAGKVVESVKKSAEAAPSASVTAQAQELIDKAKTLVSDKKFQEASAALQQLGSLALTPEQQKLVDDLKEQIKKGLAAATDGASAVGNLLKK